MNILRWIIGGLFGAAAGILVWVLFGYFAKRGRLDRMGYRFSCRIGTRYAAYLGDDDASVMKGVFCRRRCGRGNRRREVFCIFPPCSRHEEKCRADSAATARSR